MVVHHQALVPGGADAGPLGLPLVLEAGGGFG